jgi:hypothetical protein
VDTLKSSETTVNTALAVATHQTNRTLVIMSTYLVLDSCFTSLLGEQIAINVVVPVLEKYSLPPVPALGHVMRKAGNHHAGKARHLGKLPQRKEKGDRYHVDASPPT